MLQRFGLHVRNQWMGALALFLVLTGGTAYALAGSNTVFSDDITNGEVKLADIGQGAVATDEIANNQVKAADIGDGEVKVADIGQAAVAADEIATDAVNAAEIATGAVRTAEIQNGQVEAEDLAPGVAPGASGARAWGLVDASANLLRKKNVSAVTHPFEGVYCIDLGSGIDPATAVMLVGEDFALNSTGASQDDVSHVEWISSGAAGCPAGTMAVLTWVGDGIPASGNTTDVGGFDLSPVDQGFTFVIP